MPFAKVVKRLFMPPDRSPNGIGTQYREDIKGLFGQPDPGQWHVKWDDFDSTLVAAQWTPVLVGAGSVNATTTAADGGINTMTNSAAGSDATSNVQTTASFLPDPKRSLIAEAKFEVDDATNAHYGLALAAGGLTPFSYTEGIAIRKASGGTTFVIEVKKAGTTSATAAFGGAVCPVNTQVTVGFAYKGVATTAGQEFLFKLDLNDGNGPRYQSLFVPTANIPTTILGLAYGVLNGTAVARTAKTDYVFAAKDRFYQ